MVTFLIKNRSFVAALLGLLLSFQIQAQSSGALAQWLSSYRSAGDFPQTSLFNTPQERDDLPLLADQLTQFHINAPKLAALYESAPTTLALSIPQMNGNPIELELARVEILAPEFKIGTLGDNPQNALPVSQGLHYRGILKGNPQSIASLSVFDDQAVIMYADNSGTYQLAKTEDGSNKYLLLRKEDLHASAPYTCFNDESMESIQGPSGTDDRGVGCKTVQVYFECDYKLFQDRGNSVANVNAYVTSLFNQVATLYANENIGIAISEIYVWTSTDPYAGYNATSSVLNAFRTTRGTNFNGNLAHFLSTRNLGGGIAYVDAICLKQYAFGVSAITNTFQNVPTYSWSVEVVTHELGHNLGSWHTHSCQWPNGALDNCVSPEGSCAPGPAPVNGGTIMSYCHLTSYGINFNNGFGPTPGNLIRSKVLAASCLAQSGTAPGNLNATNISNTGATLNWGAVVGATTYTVQYKLSTANSWTNAGTTTATTLNLSGLAANSVYSWQVKTDCSNFSNPSVFSTGNGGGNGACTIPGGLNTTNITSNSALLQWNAVQGASNYTVQYKNNSSNTWLTAGNTANLNYNLTSLSAATLFNWRVKANCSDYSTILNFTTLSNGNGGSCSAPTGLISSNITNTSVLLSWTPVQGAISYTLQYKPASGNSWLNVGTLVSTNVSLSGLLPGTGYNWQVKANCSGWSATANFTTNNSGSGTCNAPSGLVNVSVSATAAVLRWSAVNGAGFYTLQLRYAGSNTWYTLGSVSCTQVTLSGLQASSNYEWRVKANCSDYSLPLALSTPAGLQEDYGSAALENGEIALIPDPTVRLALFPNPVNRLLNLRWEGTIPEDTRLLINDAAGRRWLDQYFSPTLDLASLPPGLYILICVNGQERLAAERFVKL